MKFIRKFFYYLTWIFVLAVLGLNALKVLRMARKYQKNKDKYTLDERYKVVYKACRKLVYLKGIKISVVNDLETARKPRLFVGNHKSNFDAVIMIKVLYEKYKDMPFCFLAKAELKKVKIIYAALELLDSLFIDRKNPREALKVLEREKELIKRGASFVIFPEGTRHYGDELGDFKSGVLATAVQTFIPVVPFSIFGSSGLLDNNKSNYRKSKKVEVTFLKELKPEEFINANLINLMENIKQNIQKNYDNSKKKLAK